MIKILEKIDGYKTYIGGGVIFMTGGLKALNLVDEDTYEAMLTIGSAIALFGIRGAIQKGLKK